MKRTQMKRTGFRPNDAPLQREGLTRTEWAKKKAADNGVPWNQTEAAAARKRRSEQSRFRAEVLQVYGENCRVCGARPVQAAHIWGAGQGGPRYIWNGIPLCPDHHGQYDRYELKLRVEWLLPAAVAWLTEQGYVRWLDDGTTAGQGWKRFEPMTPGQLAAREKMMNGAPS